MGGAGRRRGASCRAGRLGDSHEMSEHRGRVKTTSGRRRPTQGTRKDLLDGCPCARSSVAVGGVRVRRARDRGRHVRSAAAPTRPEHRHGGARAGAPRRRRRSTRRAMAGRSAWPSSARPASGWSSSSRTGSSRSASAEDGVGRRPSSSLVALAVGEITARDAQRRWMAERRAAELEELTARLQSAEAEHQRLSGEVDRLALMEQVDQQRSALLRSVSHDLRTPLATIRAVTSDLRGDTPYDDATRNELLELVSDEAERLDRLVANLLNLSRIEASGLVPDRQAVDAVGAGGEHRRPARPAAARQARRGRRARRHSPSSTRTTPRSTRCSRTCSRTRSAMRLPRSIVRVGRAAERIGAGGDLGAG